MHPYRLAIAITFGCALPLGAQAPTSWNLRVPLDSAEVTVQVSARVASVVVVAPTGTFLRAFDGPAPIARWAEEIAALAGTVEAMKPAALRDPRRADQPEYRVAHTTTAETPFVLTGGNGAWDFALPLRREQFDALLAALEGRRSAGVVDANAPRAGGVPSGTATAPGAFLEFQVDQPAAPGSRPPYAAFPPDLRGSGLRGTVRMQFVIDGTGVVRPSSIRYIGATIPLLAPPNPLFARAARDALLAAVFRPAQKDGRGVAQLVMQDFVFERE
jgi:hypothetical protein